MKLSECSANKLKKISGRKSILCFGAGANLFYVFETYKNLKLEERVGFIVDNDKSKAGTFVLLNGRQIEIRPAEALKEIDLRNYVIVITALKHQEIFSQIQNLCGNPSGTCYKAPNRRFGLTRMAARIMCRLPLGNVIVLNGEGDTWENARALGKYIAEQGYFNNKYRLVWLCEHPERFRGSRREIYLNRRIPMTALSFRDVARYYFYVGRAKYIIYENQIIHKLRMEQISVYLNHGSPPIKATKGVITLPQNLNYALSPSAFSTSIISEQYSVNRERILECGSPRTDILFSECRETKKAQWKEKINADAWHKIILWVPTFRQRKNTNRVDTAKNYPFGIPAIHSLDDLEELMETLRKNNILMILKPHLLQDLNCLKVSASENFMIMTQNELEDCQATIYDVMKSADAMLTDYSTIGFDFMLLDRPIGYITDDMKEYKLGFSIPNALELMPGMKIENIRDLEVFIENVASGYDEFAEERRRVSRLVHDYPDGNNCGRLCERLRL